MEKQSGGKSKVLITVLSILLVVSLVFNIVLYTSNNSLHKSNDTLTADLNTAREDLTTASQQAEQLSAQAAADAEAITALQAGQSALQAEYDTYKAQAETDLATAVKQGEDDVKAAQAVSDESLAALQAEFDAYKAAAQTAADEAAPAVEAESIAEGTTPAEEAALIAADDVVATVNGVAITGADVIKTYQSLVNYYGEPDAESLELYYAAAMDQEVTLKLVELTAADMGLDQFTQEELDKLYADADAEWQSALDSYASYNLALTETATDEEKAAAYAQAESYYNDLGYTPDTLRETYLQNEVYTRVTDELCKDVTVTNDEVLAYYNDIIASDKALYQYDAGAYETQMMMLQYGYADREPMYHPEGYRYVKHILLAADEALLSSYTALLASFDAQTDETAEADRVTAEEVEAARKAVLASVQPTIDEINQKLAQGVSFEDLMALYGTDPGMTDAAYANGYEVAAASSSFVPAFVTAAFSVDTIGDISAPAVSEYGVHLVQYAGDVPGGPIPLTDTMKETIRTALRNEKDNTVLNAWRDAADIQYTGVLRTYEELGADTAQ